MVLGLFAHPDDETLSAGGILALLAGHCEVHVITATRGEMGEVVAPAGQRTNPDRAALPGIRAREVAAACARLGVTSHRFLDGGDGSFTDSGMVWEDERRIRALPDPHASATSFSRIDLEGPARVLAQEIVRLRPTLVLTEEPAGGYGHPDHIRCHDVTMRAVELAAPEHQVPFVAFAVLDDQRLRLANRELAGVPGLPREDSFGLPLNPPDPQAPLHSGAAPTPDVVVDTSAVTSRVIAAMRAHQTQVHAVSEHPGEEIAGWFALTNNDLKPVPTHAALLLAPGRGTAEELRHFLTSINVPTQVPAAGLGGLYAAFLYLFAAASGIFVGFAGSFTHRSNPPWGLAIAVLAVLAGAVMTRTIGSVRTAFTYAAGVIAAVLLITTLRTGGDIIIVEDALGLGWLVGVFVTLFVGSLIGGGIMARTARRSPHPDPGRTHVGDQRG